MHSLRFAARVLAKSPGFTLVTALLLAIGLGANAVIFTAFDAVLFRPLPVRHPEELVRIAQKLPRLGVRSSFSHQYYEGLRDHASTLAVVFGEEELPVAMNQPAPAEEIRVRLVTPEFFDALGVPARYGRALTAADARDTPGAPPAVLSDSFWHRRFNSDVRAVGRTITIHGQAFVIAGIMPREFNGISVETSPDVRVPMRAYPLLARNPKIAGQGLASLDLGARLKPGVSIANARVECLRLWRETDEQGKQRANTQVDRLWEEGFEVDSLERGVSVLRDKFGPALKLLIASTLLLQFMVCANLAGLLLAHGAGRRREIAVRLALGATRGRLVRQLLLENALLTALGAAGGLAIAYSAAPLLVRALPPIRDFSTLQLTIALDLAPDLRVMGFSLLLSAATVLLFGAGPAISASGTSLDAVLRGVRASTGWRGRQALLIFQVALCTVLLAAAGLLVRTFQRLHATNPGFDAAHIVTFTADPSLLSYKPEQSKALVAALVERVRRIPGVASVAYAAIPLMRGSGFKMTIGRRGQPLAASDFLNASSNPVSPEYFDTMGMRIVEGRGLTAADQRDQPPYPVVVNQAFVRRFFPDADPLGQFAGHGTATAGGDYQIAGVVTDAKYRSLREPTPPTIYSLLSSADFFVLHVRTAMRPEAVMQPVRQALAALDPALPFVEIRTLSEEVDASAAPERLTAALAGLFGAIAALLAAVGIYGSFAYAVAQRRRELGIRMALGATPSDIGQMIGGQAAIIVAVGVALGLYAAVVTGPLVRSLLYEVAPSDPPAFAAAGALVAVVAAVAAAVPALRAAKVPAASALRQEG